MTKATERAPRADAVRNRDKLGRNQRLAMPYRTWDKMAPKAQEETRAQAAAFLDDLDASGPPY